MRSARVHLCAGSRPVGQSASATDQRRTVTSWRTSPLELATLPGGATVGVVHRRRSFPHTSSGRSAHADACPCVALVRAPKFSADKRQSTAAAGAAGGAKCPDPAEFVAREPLASSRRPSPQPQPPPRRWLPTSPVEANRSRSAARATRRAQVQLGLELAERAASLARQRRESLSLSLLLFLFRAVCVEIEIMRPL